MTIWSFDADTKERLVSLEGANNFRDLGGWRSADGRVVRDGWVYRAATLQDLTGTDHAVLEALGFTDIVDLRSQSEITRHPTRWPGVASRRIWREAGDEGHGDLTRILGAEHPSADALRAAMVKLYRLLPTSLGHAYRHIVQTLADGRGPLLFHCAAGKDRTGVASAILLRALGVSDEDVRLDYLLTNDSYLLTQQRFDASYPMGDIEQRVPGITRELFGAHDELLAAAFAAIDERYDGFEGYLETILGLDADRREQLKDRLLVA